MGEKAPELVPEAAHQVPPKKEPRLRVVEGPVEPVAKAEAKEPPKKGRRFPWLGKVLTVFGVAGMVGGGIEAADEQGVLPEPLEKPYDTGKKAFQEVGQEIAQATDRALEKVGVDLSSFPQEKISGIVHGKANLTKESPVAQTETQEKEVKNIIPITLINKEVSYQEPVKESEKAMEEAFLLALAYILKDRVKNPDFQSIPSDQTGVLINEVVEKINKGENLSFDIYLDEDYSDGLDSRTPYKVDLTKGVKIAFVDKIPDLVPVKAYESDEIMLSSRTFEAIAWNGHRDADGNWTMAAAFSEEVTQEGELTIKLYMSSDEGSLGGPIPNNFPEKTASWQGRELTNCLGIVLTTLICQEPANNLSGEGPYTWYSYPQILSLLNPGAKMEGMGTYGWSETGRPILKKVDKEGLEK